LNFCDEVIPEPDAVKVARILAPVLMNAEIGVGRLVNGVVLGALDVPLPGCEDLPRRQGFKDGVGHVDVLDQAAAAVEEADAGSGEESAVEVGAAAIVADVIEAERQCRDPEYSGAGELSLGDPNSGLRGRHDQRSGV